MTTRRTTTTPVPPAEAAEPKPALPIIGTSTPVEAAWSAVMAQVQGIGKDSMNEQQKFRFRGIDAVMNAVGPALRDHGVAVIPTHVEIIERARYDTNRGTSMVGTVVGVGYRIVGPAGDYLDGWSIGEASDAGDKGVTKAMSVAYRTFLLQALTIPTDEPDPDTEAHIRAAVPVDSSYTLDPPPARREGTLSERGQKGYEKLLEIAQIPETADRIVALAAWTDVAGSAGVLTETVMHQGKLITLGGLAERIGTDGMVTS